MIKEELREVFENREDFDSLSVNIANSFVYSKKLEKKVYLFAELIKEKAEFYEEYLKKNSKYCIRLGKFAEYAFSQTKNFDSDKDWRDISLDVFEKFLYDLNDTQIDIKNALGALLKASGSVINSVSNYQSGQILKKEYSPIITEDYELLEQLLPLEDDMLIRKYLELDDANLEEKEVIKKEEPFDEQDTYIRNLSNGKIETYRIEMNRVLDEAYDFVKDEAKKTLAKDVKNESIKLMLESIVLLATINSKYSLLSFQAKEISDSYAKIFARN